MPNLIESKRFHLWMKCGDKDHKGSDVVHAGNKLVLQHPSPLVAHIGQSLLAMPQNLSGDGIQATNGHIAS